MEVDAIKARDTQAHQADGCRTPISSAAKANIVKPFTKEFTQR